MWRGQLGFARVVEGCVSHRFDLMLAHQFLNLKYISSPYIGLRELPGIVHTKISKFYPIMRPHFL